MKTFKTFLLTAVVAMAAHLLVSFAPLGGDSYSIHLNEKLLLQHYVHVNKKLEPITLAQVNPTDVLAVRYSHCGKIGTARTITIRDKQNKLLLQKSFDDAQGDAGLSMTLNMKDVLVAARQKDIVLYYEAKELPEGMKLADIRVEAALKASLH